MTDGQGMSRTMGRKHSQSEANAKTRMTRCMTNPRTQQRGAALSRLTTMRPWIAADSDNDCGSGQRVVQEASWRLRSTFCHASRMPPTRPHPLLSSMHAVILMDPVSPATALRTGRPYDLQYDVPLATNTSRECARHRAIAHPLQQSIVPYVK
jgi:hypothetical protein